MYIYYLYTLADFLHFVLYIVCHLYINLFVANINFFSLIAVIVQPKILLLQHCFQLTMLEKIDTSEELAIVVVKEHQYNSILTGFHVYKEI